MFLLVPAHPGGFRQNPESRNTFVCLLAYPGCPGKKMPLNASSGS